MPTFNSLKELEKYVNKIAKKSIQGRNSETFKTVTKKGAENVQSEVYDVYSPSTYERTGGLKEDWETTPTQTGVEIKSYRIDEETGKNISYTVETGKGYDYYFPYYNKPRPFTEKTIEDLSKGNELKEAVAKDLRNNGLDVK